MAYKTYLRIINHIIFSIVISLLSIQSLYSQEIQIDTLYYNSEWKGVSSKYIADFYRIKVTSPNKKDWQFRDYYITGELQSRGGYISIDTSDDSNSIYEGPFQSYFKNGNIESNGNYIDGKLSGEYIEYQQNGLIKKHAYFKNGKLDGIYTEFDDNNNCIQVEYINDIPAEYYTISNSEGCISKYSTSNREPIYLSPKIGDRKTMYNDGIEWQYYTNDGLTIYVTKSEVSDYGKYFNANIFIVNNTLEPIEFNPTNDISAISITGPYRKVLSNEEYMQKVSNRQAWNLVLVSFTEGLAASGAGYSTSTTTSNSYTNGNIDSFSLNNSGSTMGFGSFSANRHSSSTTNKYDASAAYQAQIIASNRVADFNSSQIASQNIRDEGYLKRSTIYPNETIAGYVNIDRNTPDQDIIISIDVNGAKYIFCNETHNNIFDKVTNFNNDQTNESKKNQDNQLLESFPSGSFTYKTKNKNWTIESINFYKEFTKVTFRYKFCYDQEKTISINPMTKLTYYNQGLSESVAIIDSENAAIWPYKHTLNKPGDEVVYDLYFPSSYIRGYNISLLEIISDNENQMQWKNIKLKR